MLSALLAGSALGLSAGLSPGPLLTLVIEETLNHGLGAGMRVAVAPLLTDVPIVAAALLLIARASHAQAIVGLIALAGSLFLAYLGFESLTFRGVELSLAEAEPRPLTKGVVANFLNPSPYLFWLTVGGPMVVALASGTLAAACAFVTTFYVCLVGSKVVTALLVERSRRLLRSTAYVWLNRLLGVVLLLFCALFLRDGLAHLGVMP